MLEVHPYPLAEFTLCGAAIAINIAVIQYRSIEGPLALMSQRGQSTLGRIGVIINRGSDKDLLEGAHGAPTRQWEVPKI